MNDNAIQNSGSLAGRRHRVTLEVPVETPNSHGGASSVFQPLLTLWARIEARGGRERVEGEEISSRIETRIVLRWRAGVDASMRLTLGARRFAIRAAFDPTGRKRDLVCLCEEITL